MSHNVTKRRGARVEDLFGTPLSKRERQVLELIAMGLEYREVGQRLGISFHTVRNHMHFLLARLGARNAAHAVYLHFATKTVLSSSNTSNYVIPKKPQSD